MRRILVVLAAVLALTGTFSVAGAGGSGEATNPGVLTKVNKQLAKTGLNVRAEQIEYFTIGQVARRTASTPRSSAGFRTTHDARPTGTTSRTSSTRATVRRPAA
jgi:hypothetical protein